jgi:hypothetical protein
MEVGGRKKIESIGHEEQGLRVANLEFKTMGRYPKEN